MTDSPWLSALLAELYPRPRVASLPLLTLHLCAGQARGLIATLTDVRPDNAQMEIIRLDTEPALPPSWP